jgi:hypothetical protein
VERKKPVVFITGWGHDDDPEGYLIKKCEENGLTGIKRHTLGNQDILFVFDNAQQTYNDFALWHGINKTQSGRRWGPKICLFASF